MRALSAAAVLLAVSAFSPMALAQGPRPSSAHNWPGMVDPAAATMGVYPVYQYQAASAAAPRYEWREGYSHGGRWQGGWVLVQ